MELSFPVLPAKAANIEILYLISYLVDFEFELQFKLATDETVISAAHCNGHYSRVKNLFQILLAHRHIFKKMPMFGPKMHPWCFQAIFLWEDSVRNGKLALSAALKQEAPIIITATYAVPTEDSMSLSSSQL